MINMATPHSILPPDGIKTRIVGLVKAVGFDMVPNGTLFWESVTILANF